MLGLPDNEHEINLHNKYLGNNPRHQQFILSSIDVINGKMLYMRHPCYIKGACNRIQIKDKYRNFQAFHFQLKSKFNFVHRIFMSIKFGYPRICSHLLIHMYY